MDFTWQPYIEGRNFARVSGKRNLQPLAMPLCGVGVGKEQGVGVGVRVQAEAFPGPACPRGSWTVAGEPCEVWQE